MILIKKTINKFRAGANVHATSGCLRKNAMANAAYAGDPEVFELLSNQGGSGMLQCNILVQKYVYTKTVLEINQ